MQSKIQIETFEDLFTTSSNFDVDVNIHLLSFHLEFMHLEIFELDFTSTIALQIQI